ncbi:MFS transporter [Horticoccus sp. 23ND18S-11]|uniref:MFS transporter n=1 Tax=Horticoccus sp. 23ND18S-11 TaxID=3391832 RepID=UPI0039C91062
MPLSGHHHGLSPGRERATLLTLGAVQFTHILDFMIMMPLGAQLMVVFNITPAQFSYLVASYGIAAAVSGFAGGFVLDRFDRKRSLVFLYAGFGVTTLACALAPTHHTLMLARIAAGAFGGLAGSMVNAMVGDIIPPERRGRAMSYVMVAFPVASVVGVPLGLVLAGKFGWHAPFFLLAGCAAAILVLAIMALPPIRTAVHGHQPLRQMGAILSHRVHLRAFALGAVLVMAGGVLIPFIAPSFVSNVGLDEKIQLPITYIAGGLATVLSTPLVGRLSDRMDRLKLLAIMSGGAVFVVLVITHMGHASLATASVMMALFMVTMSGRFAPAMTMITNAVEARYRGGFMSVNAALQQAASAGASVLAGSFITRTPGGQLHGMPVLGYASIGFFVLTVLLAAELRAAAPHVATPGVRPQPTPAPTEAAA